MSKYEIQRKAVVLSRSRYDGEDDTVLEVGDVYDESEVPEAALEGFPERFRELPESEADSGN